MGPEGQFVLDFMPKVSRYGDLSEPRNLHRLVVDISRDMMFTVLREQYRVEVTVPVILERVREPTYAGVVEAVFRAIADLRGLPRIGNKNPGYCWNLPGIEALFPGRAKYICVVRDGRDVFLSLQGMPWGRQSAYVAAKRWVQVDQKIRNFVETIGGDRVLLVQYEQLRSAMDRTLATMEDFQKHSYPIGYSRQLIGEERRANELREVENINEPKGPRGLRGHCRKRLRQYGYETLFAEPSIGRGGDLEVPAR